MIRTSAGLFAAVTILALSGAAPAQARDFPYCLQGGEWGYPGNCQFESYQQCTTTASGTKAYCDVNPVFAFRAQQESQPQPRPHRRERSY